MILASASDKKFFFSSLGKTLSCDFLQAKKFTHTAPQKLRICQVAPYNACAEQAMITKKQNTSENQNLWSDVDAEKNRFLWHNVSMTQTIEELYGIGKYRRI